MKQAKYFFSLKYYLLWLWVEDAQKHKKSSHI